MIDPNCTVWGPGPAITVDLVDVNDMRKLNYFAANWSGNGRK